MDEVVSIGELEVLRSAAGYYIGRMCMVKEEWGEYPEPYSRESGYFKTYQEAANALKDGFQFRNAIENEHLYR